MTNPLCRLCPTPAYFDFRDGVLLCAECAAEIFKLCEISVSPVESSPGDDAPITLHSSGVVGADQSATREPQRGADQQTQDQGKHHAAVEAGVVVAHEGIPEMFRRALP